MDFSRIYFYEWTSCQLTISIHQVMLDSLLHPPNFDDWEWSTSRDYSFIKKWLPKKKKCYNHNFSRPINKVWFLILFFSAGISTSFADWPRFCYKNTSSLRWKSKHSIELKTEAWKPETEQNFFLPLHNIHNYILCLHDFTIDMDSIQKCNSAYKWGVKDISSHEKFILFRSSSSICWNLLTFLFC